MPTYRQFDVVVVPFPFVDLPVQKLRPALLLSRPEFHEADGHAILAMVTSANRSHWSSDIVLREIGPTGLVHPSVVRFKVFTLATAIIRRAIGRLGGSDAASVATALHKAMG
jgi:mRNA interferase MazF